LIKDYNLEPNSKLRDVIICIRADEYYHYLKNYEYVSEFENENFKLKIEKVVLLSTPLILIFLFILYLLNLLKNWE
jgi:hypothetical protein